MFLANSLTGIFRWNAPNAGIYHRWNALTCRQFRPVREVTQMQLVDENALLGKLFHPIDASHHKNKLGQY